MLEGGAAVGGIRAMPGHARPDPTAIYTQVSIPQLMAIHTAPPPGARLERPPGDPEPEPEPGPDGEDGTAR